MKRNKKLIVTGALLSGLCSINMNTSHATKCNLIEYYPKVVKYPIYSDVGEVSTNNLKLDMDGTTYLSLRDLGKILDIKIDWDENTHSIHIDKHSKNIPDDVASFQSVSNVKAIAVNFPIFVNGVQKAPKKPELKVNGTTYLSLRDLSDMLGTEIVWNSKLKRININTNSNYDAKQKTEWLEEEIQPKEEIQTGNYDISDEMLSLVNDFRAENSVPPLKKMTDMQGYANIRSKEIVDFFSHVRPNGEEGLDSIMAKSDYRTAGENIAAGNKDARSTFEQWKNSQGHRDNMLNPNFTHMTVGSCYSDGMYGYYHAQIFVGK